MGYTCFKCRDEIGGGVNELRYHLTHSHAMYGRKHNFQSLQDGCMRSYSDYSSYHRHLIKEHNSCADIGVNPHASNTVLVRTANNESLSLVENFDIGSDIRDENIGNDAVSDRDSFGVSRNAALLIARMRSSNSMTLSNISEVVESSSDLIGDIVSSIHTFTESKLKQVALDPSCLEKVGKNMDLAPYLSQ